MRAAREFTIEVIPEIEDHESHVSWRRAGGCRRRCAAAPLTGYGAEKNAIAQAEKTEKDRPNILESATGGAGELALAPVWRWIAITGRTKRPKRPKGLRGEEGKQSSIASLPT